MSFDLELQCLAQKYPLRLVDRIVELQKTQWIKAFKNVSLNEKIFKGHFPEKPIYPAIYVVEGLCQCAQLMYGSTLAVTAKLTDFKFTKPVLPGEQIVYEVSYDSTVGPFVTSRAKAFVDGKVVAKGTIVGCEL